MKVHEALRLPNGNWRNQYTVEDSVGFIDAVEGCEDLLYLPFSTLNSLRTHLCGAHTNLRLEIRRLEDGFGSRITPEKRAQLIQMSRKGCQKALNIFNRILLHANDMRLTHHLERYQQFAHLRDEALAKIQSWLNQAKKPLELAKGPVKTLDFSEVPAGERVNTQDEVGQDLIRQVVAVLAEDGMVRICDPNGAIHSRMKYPSNDFEAAFRWRLAERVGLGEPRSWQDRASLWDFLDNLQNNHPSYEVSYESRSGSVFLLSHMTLAEVLERWKGPKA